MKIKYGNGTTQYGPGVSIDLDGNELARAISTYLTAHGVNIDGPRTITVNGAGCAKANIYVDPSGFVITPEGTKMSGRGDGKPKAGDLVTLTVQHPIWNGIECKLIEKNKHTEQWEMKTTSPLSQPHVVYFYERDFVVNDHE